MPVPLSANFGWLSARCLAGIHRSPTVDAEESRSVGQDGGQRKEGTTSPFL